LRCAADDSLHKRPRTLQSRRGRSASCGYGCRLRSRTSCLGDGRTRARLGRSRRSRRMGALVEIRPGTGSALLEGLCCAAWQRRCSAVCWPGSAPACTRRGRAGNRYPSVLSPAGAKQIPRPASRSCSASICSSSATYKTDKTFRQAPRPPIRQNERPHGEWRSLVAHSAGGRAVAGSNPVSPIFRGSAPSRDRSRRRPGSRLGAADWPGSAGAASPRSRRSIRCSGGADW
jgi:hypothetical protein